jgi:uncharacterized pyridoxal phosphate-containing UPF0001 family protein
MTAGTGPRSARRQQLAAALADVRARVGAACTAAGRDASEITLVAVTKTFPTSDAALLLELGVADLGENRDQDAKVKVEELRMAGFTTEGALPGDLPAGEPTAGELAAAQLATCGPATSGLAADGSAAGNAPTRAARTVRWHFVGQLQTNKAASVARYAYAVHSVDRPALVDALARAVARLNRPPIRAFVQVNLDQAAGRGGAATDEVDELSDRIAGAAGLELAGLMAVAPLGADPRPAFDRLVALSTGLQRRHPGATAVSAGMSDDFADAIGAGATHLRIGSALLGARAGVVG